MIKENELSRGIAIGVGFGIAIGFATDNLGLWIALGIIVGAGIARTLIQQESKKDNHDKPSKSN